MKSLLSLVIMIIADSCAMDYTANADIRNESVNNIKVTLYYKRHFLDSIYNNDSSKYKSFLKNTSDQKGMPYHMDTTNLKATYSLKQGQTLLVSHVPGGRTIKPDYTPFDSISIQFAGIVITRSTKQLEEVFQKKETRYWVWNIH